MLKTFSVAELVEKPVVAFGNGSIVYTPKQWIGKKAIVILEQKTPDLAEEIFKTLKPHAEHLQGVFLFGSQARNEQTPDSDIDVLVVSDQEFEIKKEKFEFVVKTKNEIMQSIQSDPKLFLFSALREAKPIFNESLLQELRGIKPKPDFKRFFEDTLTAFQNVQQLLAPEQKRQQKFTDSNAIFYSLILRLKTIFLIHCFAKKKSCSNKQFFQFLRAHGLSQKLIEDFLAVFRSERNNEKTIVQIRLEDAIRLFEIAKLEFVKTEQLVKK